MVLMHDWCSQFCHKKFTLQFRILKCRIKFPTGNTIDTFTVAVAYIAAAAVAVVSNRQKPEGRLRVVHDDRGCGHDVAGHVVALLSCGRVSPEKKWFHVNQRFLTAVHVEDQWGHLN